MTVHLEHRGKIAVVTIDNPPVNATNTAVRHQLMQLAETLDADADVQAVVLCGAGKMFIGGADITEFDRPPEQPDLPSLIRRLETAAKPWTAAIHGVVFGGGLELVLGCRYRVAAPGTVFGLPEVSLGFVPGAGGTQRLPRLIGPDAAISIAAEQLRPTAEAAAALGLIDRVIAGNLLDEAVAFATERAAGPHPPCAYDRAFPAVDQAFWQRMSARVATASKGLSAPGQVIDIMRYGQEAGIALGLVREREAFLRLRAKDESRALRGLFFAERAALRPADLRGIEPPPLRRIGVVGGGIMGSGIAAALRNAGYEVCLSERDPEALAAGMAKLAGLFEAAAKRGLISAAALAGRMQGVSGMVGLQGLADCDLVIEAVFEDLAVKRAVFAELGRICRPDAILATNTSYIDPQQIAEGLPAPERFIGLHFFSPAHVMKLLEIIPLPQTATPVVAAAFELARKMGKIPVRAGLCEGFIGNRILKRSRATVEALLLQGLQPAQIDAALRGFGFGMGPFEMQDMAGLDISYKNREAVRASGQTLAVSALDLLVRAGRHGQKTGAGWYDYAPGERKPRESAVTAQLIASLRSASPSPALELTAAQIVEIFLTAMAEEGQAILDEGVAQSASDIDLVEVHGYGFPRSKGGPMFQSQARKSK